MTKFFFFFQSVRFKFLSRPRMHRSNFFYPVKNSDLDFAVSPVNSIKLQNNSPFKRVLGSLLSHHTSIFKERQSFYFRPKKMTCRGQKSLPAIQLKVSEHGRKKKKISHTAARRIKINIM